MFESDVTLQEASELLGVHYMTAYRYVRLGLLPAHKSGGIWRVRRSDLQSFRRGQNAEPETGASRRRAPWAERLEVRLIAGDGRGAWGVIEAALAAGAELDEVYIDILAPAMASIGTKWEMGEIDVSVEHRASGLASRVVGRLGPRFVRRGRPRGSVLLGTPPGERHSLPVSLVADLARQAGWEVSDLGGDVPVPSFVHAANQFTDLVAVGISVTNPACLAAAQDVLTALRESIDPSVALLVGGRAIRDEEHAFELGATGFGADGRSMVALLDVCAGGAVESHGAGAVGD